MPPERVNILEKRKIEIGDVVSYTNDNIIRKEKPANVRIFRLRNDVAWGQLVNQAIHSHLSGIIKKDEKRRNEKRREDEGRRAKKRRRRGEDEEKKRISEAKRERKKV